MPPMRPYLSDETLKDVKSLAFARKANADIWSLGFGHRAQNDIDGLAEIAAPTFDLTPVAAPEPLPIVVSPRPDVQDLALRSQPQQPAPTAMPTGQPGSPGTTMDPASPTPSSAPAAMPMPTGQSVPTVPVGNGEIETYIRQAAAKRGIDPDIAVQVALSEGGLEDPVRQSDYVYRGNREQSYGPLQLNVEGGVGSAALRAGIDPRNPAQWREAVDFGLDEVARSGWSQWHGAARVGIGDWDGIRSGQTTPSAPNAGAVSPAAPAAIPSSPAAAGNNAAGSVRVRDPWGNEFVLTPEQLQKRPGGNADLTILGPAASAQGPQPIPLDTGGSPADLQPIPLAPNQDAPLGGPDDPRRQPMSWSPDSPASPVTAQMSSGRRGGGVMSVPQPMPEQATEQSSEEFIRSLERPSGPPLDPRSTIVPYDPATGTVGNPDGTATWNTGQTDAQSSYNDPTDGGTQSQPIPQPVTPSYNDPSTDGTQSQPLPDQQPTMLPVWDANGNKVGYRQEELPPSDPTVSDSSYTQPAGRRYDPNDPNTGVNPTQPGALRPTDLPPEMQGARPWLQPTEAVPGGVQAPPGLVDSIVPRAAQTSPVPASPENPVQPPRWSPQVQEAPYQEQAPYQDDQREPAHPPRQPAPPRRLSPYVPGSGNALAGAETPPTDAEILQGQGTVARGIDAASQGLPDQRSETLVTPENRQAFMQDTPGGTPAQLLDWHERLTVGAADALARTLGQEPERTIISVQIGGVPLRMSVSDLLQNVTDPLFGAGFSVGDIVLDAAGQAALRAIAPYAKGAFRATIGRLLEGARGVGARIGEGLAENAARTARADARMAEGGSTALPGTLGVITGNEFPGMPRPRVVPPHVADTLDFPVRIPEDPAVVRAIEAAGGSVDPEKGVTLNVIRMQGPEAHGGAATRDMVFYTAGKPGTPSPYAAGEKAQVGGSERIEGPTRFRSPLILSDAPGEARGFDLGMEQLGKAQAEEYARARQAAGDALERVRTSESTHGYRAPETQQAQEALRAANAEVERLRPDVPTSGAIDEGIRQARRAGPEGSPARAQALKELVSRYGGNPDRIDALLKVRGADASESAWAIKENILAANARRAGYDGVVTVQQSMGGKEYQDALEAAVQAHPQYQAQKVVVDEIVQRYEALREAHATRATALGAEPGMRTSRMRSDPEYARIMEQASSTEDELRKANRKLDNIHDRLVDEVEVPVPHRITELADVREDLNPTPAVGGQEWQTAHAKVKEIGDRLDEAEIAIDQAEKYGTDAEWRAAQKAWSAIRKEMDAAVDARESLRGAAPGFTLRDDVKPPAMRAREAAEEARRAAIEDEAFNHPRVQAAGRRAQAADAALTEARARLDAGTGSQVAVDAATRERNAAYADHASAQRAIQQQIEARGYTDAERPRLAPGDGSPQDSTPMSAMLGAAGRTLNTEALNAAGGAASGVVVSGDLTPGENDTRTPSERLRDAGLHAAGGAVAAIGLRHGGRLALRNAEGALATLGNVPPSKVNQGMLPGLNPLHQPAPGPVQLPASFPPSVGRALTAAQRRAANMQARGLTTPSVWEWIKQAGYAGIYGPATAMSSVVGGAQELVLGQPKEAIRALVAGRPGSYGAQVKAQVRAMPEAIAGLGRVLFGDSAGATAAVSGGSQGTAGLSERVVNPVGHLAARVLERPGEVLTEAPDAIFRPAFLAQGMQREAHTIAAEAGLRGAQATAYADRLVQDAQAVAGGALPTQPGTQRVMDAAKAYADDLGYKGDPGGLGHWLGQMAKRDDALGVLASFLVPFPSMASRMSRAALRSTPGVGLIPAIRRGQPTKFDVVYDQALGTAVASGLTYWAFSGGITGSGPADQKQRQNMIDQGWQPNSVLVAGHYIPNRLFQKFQPMLDTAGEIHDAIAYGKADAKPGALATDLVKRASRIVTNQTGLSGLADLHDMLDDSFASQFPGWATRSAIRYVPGSGILRAVAASLDSNQRKPEKWADVGFGQAVQEQTSMVVPGLRQSVPATQDQLGRDAPNPQQGLGAIIPRVTTQRDDPMIQASMQAGVPISSPPDKIDGVPLTPLQQRQYQRVMGKELERLLGPTVRSPGWQTMPSSVKKTLFETFQGTAKTLAETAVIGQGGATFQQDRAKAAVDKAMGR